MSDQSESRAGEQRAVPFAEVSDRPSFCYLFERIPSFVQTFCYREVGEMVRQEMRPLIVSVRQSEDAPSLAASISAKIHYLPPEKELRSHVDVARAERRLSLRVHRAIPRGRTEPDSQRMFEAAWLGPHLRRLGVKHVHAHFGGLAARTAWQLRRLHGLRYSFTGHANDIFCESGSPITNAMLARDAEFIVTETDYARRWMEERHPFTRGKVHRVFNGVDLSGMPQSDPAKPTAEILCVGRYVEKKGYPDLIEACRLLRERDVSFRCTLVGEGPLENSLRAQIERAALADHVHLAGPRSQAEVRELLARATVFALAAKTDSEGGSDNLPTVIAEAMACGLPVVSTRIAGIPEMIAHEATGLLTAPDSPIEIAAALEKLLLAPELRVRLGSAARVAAYEKFDLAATTRVLKHLLARRGDIAVPEEARRRDLEIPHRPWWTRLGLGQR